MLTIISNTDQYGQLIVEHRLVVAGQPYKGMALVILFFSYKLVALYSNHLAITPNKGY